MNGTAMSAFTGTDTDCVEVIEQTQFTQLSHRVRLDVDADAERSKRRHRLVDATGDAGLVQAKGQ